MVTFNSKLFNKMYSEIATRPSIQKTAAEIAQDARELSMIPKYLELAATKGKDRFNAQQISELTKAFEKYQTGLSKTDLLKDLLAIGSEKGKPLSTEEISGFLKATSSFSEKEQKNVLTFLKAAKEAEKTNNKVTMDSIRKNIPYELYRDEEIKINEKTGFIRRNPDFFNEEAIKQRYETFIENEYRFASNQYYNAARSANRIPVSEYITRNNNPVFVKSIAKSENPEIIAKIIEETGVTDFVTASADLLAEAYKLSNGNMTLVTDLSRVFYPSEIKQIVELLSKEKARDFSTYCGQTIQTRALIGEKNIGKERRNVLKELGLYQKVKLIPLSRYEDVYAATFDGGIRGTRITQGNYERGKKS